MKSIAAIFRKDARHLWPQIVSFWFVLLIGVLADPGRGDRIDSPFRAIQSFLSIAQVLALATLLIGVLHEEKLPGDRQYWLTRPFTWRTLFAEKLLFIAVFVNLALLLAQSAILLRIGISPASHLWALLWRQVFVCATFVLPVAAFAVVTRNLGQVILAGFLVIAPLALTSLGFFARFQPAGPHVNWIHTLLIAAIVTVGAAAILLIQYSRRQTIFARMLIGVTASILILVSGFMPPAWTRSLDSRRFRTESSMTVTLLDPSHRATSALPTPEEMISLELPIRIGGFPPGTEFLAERFSARIQLTGRFWYETLAERFISDPAGAGQLTLHVRRSIYERARDQTVQLSGTLEFALLRGKNSFPAPGSGGEVIPGVGVCFPAEARVLTGPRRLHVACSTPFPTVAVYVLGETGRPNWVISPGSVNAPIPTDIGFDILDRYTSLYSYSEPSELRGLRLYTARPAAHSKLTYFFRDVRWADYVK